MAAYTCLGCVVDKYAEAPNLYCNSGAGSRPINVGRYTPWARAVTEFLCQEHEPIEKHMTIETYRRYRRILKATPVKGKYAPYSWGELPQVLDIAWLPYSQMFKEFSQELANVLNSLTGYTHQLAAWRDLLEPMSQQQQLSAAS